MSATKTTYEPIDSESLSSSGYILDNLTFSWLVVKEVTDPVEPSRVLRFATELSSLIFKKGLNKEHIYSTLIDTAVSNWSFDQDSILHRKKE